MQVLLLLFRVGLTFLLVTHWACGAMWPLRTFIVRDMTFPTPTPSIETLTTTSVCRCKMRCLVTVACEAFTAVRVAEQNFQCSLSTQGPGTHNPISKQGAVYGYKLAKLDSSFDVTEEADGLIYFSPSRITKNDIPSAKSYCERFPGFRLAILRTEQQIKIGMELLSNNDELRIDLQKTAQNNILIWGDGTLFNSSLNQYIIHLGDNDHLTFRVQSDGIKRVHNSNTDKHILCQGNDEDDAW